MFHGNAGNHGHRIPLAKVFYTKMRCNVLMLSYRGYGQSEGTPSEKGCPFLVISREVRIEWELWTGLCMDADTALEYVTSDPVLSQTPIVRPLLFPFPL
jgi:hypothetical protein